MVPITTVVACIITLLVSLVLPIVVLIGLAVKNKKQGIVSAWLLGAAGFFVPQMLIRLPILTVLQSQSWFAVFAQNNLFLYSFGLAFTAGLFELAGRFAVAKLMEKRLTWKRSLAAGLGHGGIEAILLIGMTYVNNLVYIFLISEAYRVEGYFLKVSEELVFDLSERFHLEESEIAHIIETCCHEGLFCESIYSRYQVLTSAEMQERYIEICIRLRRTEINIQSDYILTELPENQSKSKNLRVIGKEAAGDSSNIPPTVCPQRKEMKRNEKKSHPSLPSPEKGRGEDRVIREIMR